MSRSLWLMVIKTHHNALYQIEDSYLNVICLIQSSVCCLYRDHDTKYEWQLLLCMAIGLHASIITLVLKYVPLLWVYMGTWNAYMHSHTRNNWRRYDTLLLQMVVQLNMSMPYIFNWLLMKITHSKLFNLLLTKNITILYQQFSVICSSAKCYRM